MSRFGGRLTTILLVVWLVAPRTGAPADSPDPGEPATAAEPTAIESLALAGVDTGAAA